MVFVVNGAPVVLHDIDPAEDWATLKREALLLTENAIDRPWELRTSDGARIDEASPVSLDVETVYVTLALGAGGDHSLQYDSGIFSGS